MKPQRSDFVRSWWRCFAVQGSWNYRTLVGGGLAYAMLPLLRRVHAGDPVRLRTAVERNMESFNGHPYLCPMAVAALAKLEAEGCAPEKIERFRTAIQGPLGTVGDRAVWAQWRPFSLLVAIVAHGLLGLGVVASVGLFLLIYNAGHVAVSLWAFRCGWKDGLAVGAALRDSWIERSAARLWPVNLVLLGAAVVLVGGEAAGVGVAAGDFPTWVAGVAILAGLAAFRWPLRGGRSAAALLLSIPVVWVLLVALA